MNHTRIKDTIIKALSLGTGLAVGLLLIAKVCFEMSYDSFYKDIDRIYWIYSNFEQPGQKETGYEQCSGAIAPGIRQYAPGVESATRITGFFDQHIWRDQNGHEVEGFSNFADTCFFDVFDREILAGNPKKALGEWGSIMVSRSFAEKMGGIEDIIGKQICNIQMPELLATINGVYEDFPENGTIPFDVLISMETYSKSSTENWVGNDRYRGFVKLQEGVDPSSLKDAIRLMQENHQNIEEIEAMGTRIWYTLRPLSAIHTSDPHTRNMMFILSLVALLLLAISVMNYVLIAISAIVKRSKEVGVRKAYGAESRNIYGVLFKETAVNMGLSLIVAAAIIYAAKPVIENLLGVTLHGLLIPQTIVTLTIVCLLIFIISAMIPGYLYAKIPVSAALKNYKENRRNWKKALLLVQFVINVFLVAMMLVIAKQYQKAMNDDPGYEFENLVGCSFDSMTSGDIRPFVERVAELPEVIDIERSYGFPAGGASGNNVFLSGGQYMELFNVADQYEGTDGFFEILEIPFIDGRAPRSNDEVAVSRSFVEKMMDFQDWSDGAVGKHILITEHSETDNQTFTVSGVYEDYRIGTMNASDPRPSVKFWEDGNAENSYSMPLVMIKLNKVNQDIIGRIQRIVDELYPERRLEIVSFKEEIRGLYSEDRKMRNTIMIGCIFSVLIALFGLIGYIRDESVRRSKEMAVRKINGASTKEIMNIFIKDVFKLILIAVVIGDIGAWLAAEGWLRQFAEKITLTPWYFLATDIIVMALIIGAVILNCLRISRSNPVESLKNE
ncbi:MAG: FtsX-like permease family protein [Bacteroidales bacterium]|nr:FtsX-like permease family protein [Bacteroidales bacterium]